MSQKTDDSHVLKCTNSNTWNQKFPKSLHSIFTKSYLRDCHSSSNNHSSCLFYFDDVSKILLIKCFANMEFDLKYIPPFSASQTRSTWFGIGFVSNDKTAKWHFFANLKKKSSLVLINIYYINVKNILVSISHNDVSMLCLKNK
jgi:hypothetical protein